LPDQTLANLLMIGSESGEILFIEEMGEWSMSDIVQQSPESEKFFNIIQGGNFCLINPGEGWIESLREGSSHMHRPERMLKSSVLRGRIHPASTLKLEDATKSLDPRGIDHIPFCILSLHAVRHQGIVVNRICDQPGSLDGLALFHSL
jgi:hypothetical protein